MMILIIDYTEKTFEKLHSTSNYFIPTKACVTMSLRANIMSKAIS